MTGERGTARDEQPGRHEALTELIAGLKANLSSLGPAVASRLAQLSELQARLHDEHLQLAVLGQFKRGKSTVLNALLGAPIVPMGVTPLTAIPTFIEPGEGFHLRTISLSGDGEDIPALNPKALGALLAARVTEEGNPHNRLGLARVHVVLPSSVIPAGTAFVDTPGIGSTHRHNTEAAHGVLAECDAALFVVSSDPPITQAEIEYLGLIRKTVPRLILVLNKIDLVEDEDRRAAIDFLKSVASKTEGLADAPLFCISARQALRAKIANDRSALEQSGLAALERHVANLVDTEKAETLERAIARKVAVVVDDLRFETASRLAALRMPLDRLSERVSAFEKAALDFKAERLRSHDLIDGDRKRLLAGLDLAAEDLRASVSKRLGADIASAHSHGASMTQIAAQMRERIPEIFQAEFQALESRIRREFDQALGIHQANAAALIDRVRRLAAELLEIPYRAPAPAESFVLKSLPYWVTDARESLVVAPTGVLNAVLPLRYRRRQETRRLSVQTEEIVARNVENLRWSLRRNLEDGLRSFEARLDNELSLALDATGEALRLGLARRGDTAQSTEAETQRIEAAIACLDRAASRLSAWAARA